MSTTFIYISNTVFYLWNELHNFILNLQNLVPILQEQEGSLGWNIRLRYLKVAFVYQFAIKYKNFKLTSMSLQYYRQKYDIKNRK